MLLVDIAWCCECTRGGCAPEGELELAPDVGGAQQVAVVQEMLAGPAFGPVRLVPAAPDVEKRHQVAFRRCEPATMDRLLLNQHSMTYRVALRKSNSVGKQGGDIMSPCSAS